jgi:2'-5' RNA ligase
LGFEKEDKPFAAHITIGRVKTSRFLRPLAEGIGKIDADNVGTQRVSSVAIMRSELGREGPTYTPVKVIGLMG